MRPINKEELGKARREVITNMLGFASAYNDTGIKVPMITGRYMRSGARGMRFHVDKKWHDKYKKDLTGINLPALESPTRLGVSELGNYIRHNLKSFNKYSHYKRLDLWQKIVYTITLKKLPSNAFGDSFAKCKKIHEEVLRRKRLTLFS